MTKRAFLMLTMGLWIAAAAAQQSVAQGNPNCAPRQQVIDQLRDTYGETRQSVGLSSEETLVEIYASRTSGSWTITVTLPTGITCLVASGLAFESMTGQTLQNGKAA
jgi:hypothetical protein